MVSNEEEFIRGASRATIALIRLNLNMLSLSLSLSLSRESIAIEHNRLYDRCMIEYR